MKKNLHLGFIIICTLIVTSNIFLFLHSKKGGGVLSEIISDITPGAIAMTEMANYTSEIGHYYLHCVVTKGYDADALQHLEEAVQLLRKHGRIHLLHERHIGLEEKKAAEELIEKINILSDSVDFFYQLNQGMDVVTLQEHESKVVHNAINDLNELLLSHKEIHLKELNAAHTLILSKKNTLNVVIMTSSIILSGVIILIWWMTIRIHNRFTAEQKIQQKQIELDFIEKKKIEEKLSQAKKMEVIGQMAGGVAHDLNNILSGIVGYPELILQKLPQESELRKPIEAIQETGQRAAMVVADLLTVARGAASVREVHNLNSLILEYLNSPECQKLKALHPKIACQHQLAATQATISCSPVHVKKCLMNLTTNAFEAIINQGTVVISTHNQYIDDLASAEKNMEVGEYVVLSVEDTGPGIAEQDLGHVFEPFYTKKIMGRSGTGLGLAVVWNTMEDHKGKVFVESSEQGTCFQLYFSVSKGKESIPSENHETSKFIGKGEHILIVDDESHLRDIASKMLLTLSYTPVSVCSGELAIKFLEETPVDLVIIDMLMEPGMNGRQTYKEILKLYPGQKAIIASGFSESADVKATIQLGASGFIKKPYSMNQLGQAVKGALNS